MILQRQARLQQGQPTYSCQRPQIKGQTLHIGTESMCAWKLEDNNTIFYRLRRAGLVWWHHIIKSCNSSHRWCWHCWPGNSSWPA